MEDLQTKNAFVSINVFFKEGQFVSLKSVSEVGCNDLPKNQELSLRQNFIETEVREQITDDQTNLSDQVAGHESVLQKLKHERESRDSDSEAGEGKPQLRKSTSSTFSSLSGAFMEQIRIVLAMSASERQRALKAYSVPTGKTTKPYKSKREMKVPTRFGKHSTQSSIKNDEKEPLLKKLAAE